MAGRERGQRREVALQRARGRACARRLCYGAWVRRRARRCGARRTFLMIMTRKGSLMPSVRSEKLGHVTNVVEMLVDMISSTDD